MRTTSVDLEQRQRELVEKMEGHGDADSQSEAIRDAIEHYAQDLGYVNGRKRDTQLRAMMERAADATALMGIVWVGLTFLFPLGFRAFAIPIFAVAVALYAADRVLAAYEPAVSRRLLAAVGLGDRAQATTSEAGTLAGLGVAAGVAVYLSYLVVLQAVGTIQQNQMEAGTPKPPQWWTQTGDAVAMLAVVAVIVVGSAAAGWLLSGIREEQDE